MQNHDSQPNIPRLAQQVASYCQTHALTIATAESCTGGLLAKVLTDLPGASNTFECGWVTYSNQAKANLLHIPAERIAEQGAVSEAIVQAMATQALRLANTHIGIATSGIAGPDGGTADKPVGTVWIAVAFRATNKNSETKHKTESKTECKTECLYLNGDRDSIRTQTVAICLQRLLTWATDYF